MKKKFLILITLFLILSTIFACNEKNVSLQVKELEPYIFDTETITSIDYKFAEKYFAKLNDNWGGGCSCVAKVLPDGHMVLGRNMDLNISNKCAYIVHTNCKDKYKTVGTCYTFRDYSPDYNDVKVKGLSSDFVKILPLICDDILNEKGLFVEVNMRNAECWPAGQDKFACSGTNPNSKERVYMFGVSRYLAENCATVEEAVEYAKKLNVYSKDRYWNYCFMLADATGNYGLLEFCANEVIWLPKQFGQTNFYLNEIANAIQDQKNGEGRLNTLKEGIDKVNTKKDMYDLIKKVSYFQFYDPLNCNFDPRSENIGTFAGATYNFLMNPKYKNEILYLMDKYGEPIRSMSKEELKNKNEYWQSSFTEVIDCNEKSIFIRFFENENSKYKITLDNIEKTDIIQ